MSFNQQDLIRQIETLVLTVITDRLDEKRRRKMPYWEKVIALVWWYLLKQKPIHVDEIARELAVSGPTLRRNLAYENTSFQRIVDYVRYELADHLLVENKYTVDEIAYVLGFSAASGFSRAYKDWSGRPPSDSRSVLLAARHQTQNKLEYKNSDQPATAANRIGHRSNERRERALTR